MDKVFQHTKHVALWNECIKILKECYQPLSATDLKVLAFRRLNMKSIKGSCFACEHANEDCCECPLDWGLITNCCSYGSPYEKLDDLLGKIVWSGWHKKEAIKLCEQIRDLPIIEGVKYE